MKVNISIPQRALTELFEEYCKEVNVATDCYSAGCGSAEFKITLPHGRATSTALLNKFWVWLMEHEIRTWM